MHSRTKVFLDPAGIPIKYDQMEIFKDAIGTAACRIAVDIPHHKSWKASGLVIDTDREFDEKWKHDMTKGAEHVLQTTYITASDCHLDAKLWPVMHPYGTGSLWAEIQSGGMHRLIKNRLLCIQNCFRMNNLYSFWLLHRIITRELFFRHVMSQSRGTPKENASSDPMTRLYGTVMPASIPESRLLPWP